MFRRILVPLDATERDAHILEQVATLAQAGGEIVLLRVACYDARERDQMQREITRAEQALREAKELLATRFALEAEEALLHGDPAEVIASECESRKCDLIAMATHGHGALYDFLLGSVANEVRHRVSVPVMTLRVALPKRKGRAQE